MNTRIVRLATLLAAAWAVPAAAVTYEDGIRQAVEKYCSECHGSDAPSMAEFKADKEKYKKDKLGPRMDSYDNLMVMVNGSDTG
ncbi:MAG: hypothetical protein PHS77_00835, partial [Gallionellaceae bacterium]|nr:hypothetical protein [Gallionellaceae bacterium]